MAHRAPPRRAHPYQAAARPPSSSGPWPSVRPSTGCSAPSPIRSGPTTATSPPSGRSTRGRLTMATFVLIHGAGDSGGPVVRWLHRTPGVRPAAGGPAGPGGRDGPPARRAAGRLVGQHRLPAARREHDERAGGPPADDIALFLHDVPPDLAAEALRRGRDQSTASPSATPRSWPTTWRRTGPSSKGPPARSRPKRPERAAPGDQLHPLVVPHDSQTKHEPAGRIRTPQVEQ